MEITNTTNTNANNNNSIKIYILNYQRIQISRVIQAYSSNRLKRWNIKTHPNFISFVPFISQAQDIDNCIYKGLLNQFSLKLKTATEKELLLLLPQDNVFFLDVEQIDRLYHVAKVQCNRKYIIYDLIARLDYNNTHLYVKMTSHRIHNEYFGTIFITTDANSFMKLIFLEKLENKKSICESLVKDGIYKEENEEEEDLVSTLKYMCYKTIYLNKLDISKLPQLVIDNLTEFINFKNVERMYKSDEGGLLIGSYLLENQRKNNGVFNYLNKIERI